MAITKSGIFLLSWFNHFEGADSHTWDMDNDITADNDTVRGALLLDSYPFGFRSTGQKSLWTGTHEVSGTGYTAGGNDTIGYAYMNDSIDAGDEYWFFAVYEASAPYGRVEWPNSTISNAKGLVLYNDDHPSDWGIGLWNFGAEYSTSNGLFRVTLNDSFSIIRIYANP